MYFDGVFPSVLLDCGYAERCKLPGVFILL